MRTSGNRPASRAYISGLDASVSLKLRSGRATIWSAGEVFLRQGLGLGISMALARLLAPEEFGTIALLYLFTGVAGVFVDSGFSSALIQRKNVTATDESTVFWINLLLGALVGGSLALAAPLIAKFYEVPILVPLTYILALNIFLSAFISIHVAILTRALEFKTQMKVTTFATFSAGVVGVGLAWHGFGVWALAAQTLTSTILTAGAYWLIHRWRPNFEFSTRSAKSMFGFGGFLLASSILDVAYRQLYSVILGKWYSLQDVAFFGRALGTRQIPITGLSTIVGRVSFPAFSSVSSDPVRLQRGVSLGIRLMMLINFPMMVGLGVLAEPVVHVLFGEQWLTAAPILQVLCIGGILWPMHVINIKALLAQGESRLVFYLEIWKKVLGVTLIVFGAYFGVMGIAWSTVAMSVLSFVLNTYYTSQKLRYGAVRQIRDVMPLALPTIAMGLVISQVDRLLALNSLLTLVVLVPAGMAVFFGFARILRVAVIKEAVTLVKNYRNSGQIDPIESASA